LIANGDIFSLSDAKKVQERTGCAGVMAARGLLENPMLFSGIQGGTDWDCVNYFVDRAVKFGMNDALIFNHVIFMTSPNAQRLFTSPQERLDFINHRNILSLIDFVRRKKFEANNFIYSS
jgi:tRNA-dihydrouridine synthase 4